MPAPRTRPRSPTLAKLTQPRLPKVLERKRLFRLLDATLKQSPIVWICAPPGAGKTTLVASYIKARKRRPIWYQVDEGDADPGTLFYYLGLANRQAAPRYRHPLPHLAPEYLPNIQAFTRRFFERFYHRLKPPGMMVFDNYQELPDEALTQSLLKIAFQGLPDGYTVIVLSRTPPPTTMASFQAGRKLAILDSSQLALTVEETKHMVRLSTPKQQRRMTAQTAMQIHDHTQGWVAGVVLWVAQRESLEGDATDLKVPIEITPVMFDYLATEVFLKQPPTHQTLLLKTAFMPSFTAVMAEQLTGNADARFHLAKLARARYFTERRHGLEPTYQYHPLFRRFLVEKALLTWTPQQVQDIRSQTAHLLEQGGQVEEAVDLLFAAEQYKQVAQLILGHVQAFFIQGRSQMVEGWLNRMPGSMVDGDPWLRYWLANCCLLKNPNASVPIFEEVFHDFQKINDPVGALLTGCGAINAISSSYSDMFRLDPWLDALPPLLKATMNTLPVDLKHRAICTLFSGMACRRLHDPSITSWAKQTESLLGTLPDLGQRVFVGKDLYFYYCYKGEFRESRRILHIIKEWTASQQFPPLFQVILQHMEGHFCWSQGNGSSCVKAVERAQTIAVREGLDLLLGPLLVEGVTGAILIGDLAKAIHFIEQVRPFMEHAPGILGTGFHFMAGNVAYLQNDYQTARHHFEKLQGLVVAGGWDFVEGLCLGAVAQFHIEQHEWAVAKKHIQRIHELAGHLKAGTLSYIGFWAEAQLGFIQSKNTIGIRALRQALSLSRTHGLFYISGMLPHIIARLCGKALDEGVEIEQARRIIKRLNLIPESPALTTQHWPWPVKIHALGRFSLRVEEHPVEFGRKAPRGLLLLLKALIASGGTDVPVTRLADTLWPDADGDAASASFTTTLARLRKRLGHSKALVLHEEKLSLNVNYVWVDSLSFERRLIEADVARQGGEKERALTLTEQALAVYQGPFLMNESYSAWIVNRRESLQKRYAQAVSHLVDHWETQCLWENIITCLRQALRIEPTLRNGWNEALVRALRKSGRPHEAKTLESML